MSIRQDIIQVLNGHESRKGEGNGAIYEGMNVYLIRDNEMPEVKAILSGLEFSEMFYNVESETYLRWDKVSDCFWNIEANEPYMVTIFSDDFSDLIQSAADWSFVNGSHSNIWHFGVASVVPGFNNAMYISNNGGTTNQYSSGGGQAGVSHSTVDIVVPVGQTVKVKLLMRSNGEPGFDDLRVFAYNTPTVPVSDVNQPALNQQVLVVGQVNHQEYEFELDNTFTGTTMTLSMQWDNDGSVTGNPPAHIQKVEVLYK